MDSVRKWHALALALGAWGCVSVGYQSRGQHITPRAGKTLVFGRLRFFFDAYEFFPWNTTLIPSPIGTDIERHVWLLRLSGRAISAEVHPDPDGSLAIWVASGDYALVGSTVIPTEGAPYAPYEVVALFRVTAGPVAAYAGELRMVIETREGFHPSYGEFGTKSVVMLPLDTARAMLERKLGTLSASPVASPWCAGDDVPAFTDPKLAARAKQLLDHGCDAR